MAFDSTKTMITILLPPELESSLNEEAQRLGVSPETLAVEGLRAWLNPGGISVLSDRSVGATDPDCQVPGSTLPYAFAEPSRIAPGTPDPLIVDGNETGTMLDFLSGYVGTVNSREFSPDGAHLSEACGRKFAEGMLQKRRQRQL